MVNKSVQVVAREKPGKNVKSAGHSDVEEGEIIEGSAPGLDKYKRKRFNQKIARGKEFKKKK